MGDEVTDQTEFERMSDIFDQYEAECRARLLAEERLRTVAATGGLTSVGVPADTDETWGN